MADHVDLVVQLFRPPGLPQPVQTVAEALITMRWQNPQSIMDQRAVHGRLRLSRAALAGAQTDPLRYGALLAAGLFSSEPLRAALRDARAAAAGLPLRIRLEIDESAAELHSLRWECLVDPLSVGWDWAGLPRDQATDALDLPAGWDAPRPAWLLSDPRLPFSRFLSGDPFSEVPLRPRGRLRALVVVASPPSLAGDPDDEDDTAVKPIKVADELARAKAGLGDDGTIIIETLASGDPAGAAVTLNRLAERLGAEGGCDILYLMCHGEITRPDPTAAAKVPCVLLEKEERDRQGPADDQQWVPVETLVEQVKNLRRRPVLVVLASCKSAGTGKQERSRGDGGILAALGPRLLSAAGVGAVIGMQGKVSMDSMAAFSEVFFQELRKDGRIDQATAVARNRISEAHDKYMPALFMRLRHGVIDYRPGFSENDARVANYIDSLRASLRNGECTPVIGPGMVQQLFGSPRDLARALLAGQSAAGVLRDDDLPQVLQYLAASKKRELLVAALVEQLLRALCERARPALDPARRADPAWATVERAAADLLERAAALLRICDPQAEPVEPGLIWDDMPDSERRALLSRLVEAVGASLSPGDPYRILAGRRQKIYITTNPDDLLAAALRASAPGGKVAPVIECFRWHSGPGWPESIYQREPQYEPSLERPLIFHLFGRYAYPETLVLSEDDYFDYLMAIGQATNITVANIPQQAIGQGQAAAPSAGAGGIPVLVRAALVRNALLFLGFQVDDWAFRAAFRSLLPREYRPQRINLQTYSVSVQIAPEERSLSPQETRDYFRGFFDGAGIAVYWGQTDDFIGELTRRKGGGQ